MTAAVYQLLLPGLVDRYRAKLNARRYASETPLFTSILREEHAEEFIEISSRTDGRLVTLVDVVSPANKTTPAGRAAYLATRARAVAQRAGVVEIDLVTQGKPTLDFSRDGLPEYDHAITVTRGATPDRYEIYTATIQKRLPKFKLPLAADDRDTVFDLQVALVRGYEQGNFEKQLNYTGPLPADVKLTDTARAWVDTWLKQLNVK
ncbi:hypothetical protein FRUB_05916 [Fimbriiglobus ruber]|uniref:Uncharacterized protein n=2 Tax=Fimbriiglobus ruber TaxID=1908690 RepID=A0A225DEC7_9BACT|nr:hypothetical protein FRUB_05916 [Fimbriiglobus ruber]